LTAGSDRSIRLWNPSRLDPAFPPPRQQQLYSGDISDSDDIPIPLLPRALPIQVYDDGINYIPTAMAITEDTTRLFVACDKTAVLLDSVTTKVLRQFHGHVAVINDVAMLSTAAATIDVLATASYDATVCLWDGRSNSHRPIQTLKEAKDSVTCVDMSQQQAVVRTASVDGCVRTYDVRKGILQSVCGHSRARGTHSDCGRIMSRRRDSSPTARSGRGFQRQQQLVQRFAAIDLSKWTRSRPIRLGMYLFCRRIRARVGLGGRPSDALRHEFAGQNTTVHGATRTRNGGSGCTRTGRAHCADVFRGCTSVAQQCHCYSKLRWKLHCMG
jgi:WD domain, G-beta repeat